MDSCGHLFMDLNGGYHVFAAASEVTESAPVKSATVAATISESFDTWSFHRRASFRSPGNKRRFNLFMAKLPFRPRPDLLLSFIPFCLPHPKDNISSASIIHHELQPFAKRSTYPFERWKGIERPTIADEDKQMKS